MTILYDKEKLFSLMQQQAIIITPNNRLSQALLQDYFKQSTEKTVDKPRCLPLNIFLEKQYQQLCYQGLDEAHPLLLSSNQFHFLWLEILKNNGISENFLEPMQDAWTSCHLWGLNFSDKAFSLTSQSLQFQKIALQIQQKLRELNAISQVELIHFLINKEENLCNTTLVFACFDDVSPALQYLQQSFARSGAEIIHYELEEKNAKASLLVSKNEEDEYLSLCAWLKKGLAESAKIAIVIPELEDKSKKLIRLLENELPGLSYNISLGQPLNNYPLVGHALLFLSLNNCFLNHKDLNLLLHSPFLGESAKEMLVRAEFAENSSLMLEEQIAYGPLIISLNEKTPFLAARLKTLTAYPEEATIKDWITLFKERLYNLGFPGEYSLNSENYQCYLRFLSLFDEFRQLAFIGIKMKQVDALNALITIAKKTLFQAQTTEAQIQILGLLEASGSHFDKLWLLGFHDQILPQKLKPSPFIPLSLQKEKHFPHASLEREKILAENIINRFRKAAVEIIFSYPLLSDDKPNLPCSLIRDLPIITIENDKKTSIPIQLEEFVENYQLPMNLDEPVLGGTSILANQAKCPFRAFAAHRLHAKKEELLSDGPNAKERGILIHKIMELLWLKLENQQKLLSLSEDDLENIIEELILKAIEPLVQQRPYSFPKLIQDVELRRLKNLVSYCLQWERERPPFSIEALEQSYAISLGQLHFTIRVDRLDKLSDGSKWVIDYKSSLPSPLPWREDRPEEPQLLLYALLDETIKGLMFSQIKSGKIEVKGLSEEDHQLKGFSSLKKDESWESLQTYWQEKLNELSLEFSQGHCAPIPLKSSLCQRCDYQDLCRFAKI